MNKYLGVALLASTFLAGCASTIEDTHYAYRVEGDKEFTPFAHGDWNCWGFPITIDAGQGVTVTVRAFEAKETDIVVSLLGKNARFADETFTFRNAEGTFPERPHNRDSHKPWYRGEPEYFYHLTRPISEGTLVFPDLVVDGDVRKLPLIDFRLRTGPRKDLTSHWVCNIG